MHEGDKAADLPIRHLLMSGRRELPAGGSNAFAKERTFLLQS